jgi:hypothetical protein
VTNSKVRRGIKTINGKSIIAPLSPNTNSKSLEGTRILFKLESPTP